MTRATVSKEQRVGLASREPDWLQSQRTRAYELHQELPMPERAVHRWRYTDPQSLLPGERPLLTSDFLAPVQSSERAVAAHIRRVAGGPGHFMVGDEAQRAGLIAMDLSAAARERSEIVEPLLGRLVPPTESPFTALNAALWSGGLYLEVPAGVELTLPVRHTLELGGKEGVFLPRTLIVLGDGARLTFLDEVVGDGEQSVLMHRAIEVALGAGARLDVVTLNEAPSNATLHGVSRVRMERDAQLSWVFGGFGGAQSKNDLTTELLGPGGHADILGLVFGKARQRFDHHVVQRHVASDCTSQLDVRAVLDGKAHSSTTGLLWIGEDGARSQAVQENRNLLLSKRAHAISLPELEILTDEVQAKHGATVGPIDEEQLYYLQARGLPREQAVAMIVAGFFEALVARIPDERLREQTRTLIEERLAR